MRDTSWNFSALLGDDGKDDGECQYDDFVKPTNDKSLQVQLVLSLVLGVGAFLTFCFLRPRWPALYASRKRYLGSSVGLPKLPGSAFGWISHLYKISEEEVLASAGLDAFVFLAFFKMSTRLFALMAFFATVVLLPINVHYENRGIEPGRNTSSVDFLYTTSQHDMSGLDVDMLGKKDGDKNNTQGYLWAYAVFTYFFAGLTIYYLNKETFRVIRYRQDYLGSQSTVTDRTFRLTGIPQDLRSEQKLKEMIEKLDIGTVDTITLCRDWRKLDDLVDMRDHTLRNLEAAWATLIKYQEEHGKTPATRRTNVGGNATNTRQDADSDEEAGENGHLLENEPALPDWEEEGRPKAKIPYGFLGWRSRKVDAIDYYSERLRRLDERIVAARKKEYTPTDMALVTMDSVASCQMVIQARIDPRPGRLLTKITPSPDDLVWRNTYVPRGIRRLKSWAVTIFVIILTLIWLVPTAFLASLLSICAIRRAAPDFARWLEDHAIIHGLVRNGVPTLVVSLLNVAVPYLYDWLSNCQGMISQGDVELSVISKNFFFTFFNTFFAFAVFHTGLDFWSVMKDLQDFLKNTSGIPNLIAKDVEKLSLFYTCFIMLQGIGLMPFRILEVGSVFLYPIYRWLSKTPRDFAELKQPPVFQYGFYLPTALLIFNLCLIYSVSAGGYVILIFGTLYFALGYFTFKYMVLYAMDQPQHATGGAWRITCYRIIVGLVVFELVMIGQLATKSAFLQSSAIFPLIPFTIWYSYYISKRFDPLTMFIALRAIKANEDSEEDAIMEEAFEDEGPRPSRTVLRRGSTLDEYKEKGLTFVNPSLVVPLQQPWIYHDPPPLLRDDETEPTRDDHLTFRNADSSLGIGEDNVWRDNGGDNV